MKAEHSPKIAEIKTKVQKLIYLHRETVSKLSGLSTENDSLKSKVEQQDSLIKQMNENIKTLQVARKVVGGTGDNHQLRLKVNELIREVDKCLSMLNN